jgi:hypothetical protein
LLEGFVDALELVDGARTKARALALVLLQLRHLHFKLVDALDRPLLCREHAIEQLISGERDSRI